MHLDLHFLPTLPGNSSLSPPAEPHRLAEEGGGGPRGPKYYSFPLCAFIHLGASEQPVRTWIQVKKLLWWDSLLDPRKRIHHKWRGGGADACPLPSSIHSSCHCLSVSYKVNFHVISPAPPFCRSGWLVLVPPSAGWNLEGPNDSMDKQSSWQLSPGHLHI